jgi:hypothetical protein
MTGRSRRATMPAPDPPPATPPHLAERIRAAEVRVEQASADVAAILELLNRESARHWPDDAVVGTRYVFEDELGPGMRRRLGAARERVSEAQRELDALHREARRARELAESPPVQPERPRLREPNDRVSLIARVTR